MNDRDASLPLDRELIESMVLHPERHAGLAIVQSRRKRGKLRRVLIYQDRIVIKQYTGYPWNRWRRPHWHSEHVALERLQGLPVPATYGYFAMRQGTLRSHVYVRECIAGKQLVEAMDPLAAEVVPELAELVAAVHRHNVITNDYSLYNILRAPDGTLRLFDFHRARLLTGTGARYWLSLGRDLEHIYGVSCRRRPDLFRLFLRHYFAAMGATADSRKRLTLWGCRLACWRDFERGPSVLLSDV